MDMKNYEDLLNDVALQMKTFGRPSEENVVAMMQMIIEQQLQINDLTCILEGLEQ